MPITPLVSVIIPVKNRSELLKETLQSLINQTYSNWEACLIDDDSEAIEKQKIITIAKSDNRVKLFERKGLKSGGAACRNEGRKSAKGELIIFLDSDDLLAPFCLEQRVKIMNENPRLDYAVFPMLLFNKEIDDLRLLVNIKTKENDLDRFLKKDHVWLISGPIWRKTAIEKIEGFNEELPSYQDYEFHIKALAHGLKYEYINTIPDNFYRQHTGERVEYRNREARHLLGREKMLCNIYEVLKSTSSLNRPRRLFIARHFMDLANDWKWFFIRREKNIERTPGQVWSNVKRLKILDAGHYIAGKIFLSLNMFSFLYKMPGIQSEVNKKFQQLFLSELFFNRNITRGKINYTGEFKRI